MSEENHYEERMSTPQTTQDEQSYAERAALSTLLGEGPRVKILAVLLAEGRDTNVTTIADLGGMSRSSVYRHIDTLIDLGVVEQTREVSGSPLYQLNRDSQAAERLAQLEYELVELVADGDDEGEESLQFSESPP